MSKIAVTGNASGTGVFTLAAPDSNTDRTLTLPDEAGSVLTDASDIEPQVKTATNASGDAPVYACRAWVNFDGTGTVSIRESGNVSSITDNGPGDYTIHFATSMPDSNYCLSGSASSLSKANPRVLCGPNSRNTTRSTSSVAVLSTTVSGDGDSEEFIEVMVNR